MALFVSGAGTVVPAGGAPLTRRDVFASAAVGMLAAGAPRLAGAVPKFGGTINMHSYSFPPPNWHPHVTNTVQIMSSSTQRRNGRTAPRSSPRMSSTPWTAWWTRTPSPLAR